MQPLPKCAICGVGATEYKVEFGLNEAERPTGKINIGVMNAEWKKPTYLRQCPKCRRFYCNNHQTELLGQECKQCKDIE